MVKSVSLTALDKVSFAHPILKSIVKGGFLKFESIARDHLKQKDIQNENILISPFFSDPLSNC